MKSLIVIDNFYPNPKAIINEAMQRKFIEPDGYFGWRTTEGYFPNNFNALLEKKSGLTILDITMPEGSPFDNGTFYMSFKQGVQYETPCVHWDTPASHYVCIIYLAKNIPLSAGTSFFKHKKTGVEFGPTEKLARSVAMTKKSLKTMLERDGAYQQRFVETDRISFKYNRAIIFPANRLHRASEHFGSSLADGRIFQAFTFKAR